MSLPYSGQATGASLVKAMLSGDEHRAFLRDDCNNELVKVMYAGRGVARRGRAGHSASIRVVLVAAIRHHSCSWLAACLTRDKLLGKGGKSGGVGHPPDLEVRWVA